MYERVDFGEIVLRQDRPYVIAEAGVNHENDLNLAIRMVDEAANAGADAIKFQSYKADTLASKNSPAYWDLNAEPTTSQHALFRKYDRFDVAEYETLAGRARERGIAFVSTPFDLTFADALAPLMPFFKVASADLTNIPLVRHLAKKGKPLVLSTGASTLGEVEAALATIRVHSSAPVAILHCVLCYPTAPENANLGMLRRLQAVFPDVVVGYSDHVRPLHSCLALTTAWLLGARIIEKHFTLDKSRPGNDHYHAMDPEDLREFREQCDFATLVIGQERRHVLECEIPARRYARRSVVAAVAMPVGHFIKEGDLVMKRPGTGIEPQYVDLVVGSRTRRPVDKDEVLQWDALLDREARPSSVGTSGEPTK